MTEDSKPMGQCTNTGLSLNSVYVCVCVRLVDTSLHQTFVSSSAVSTDVSSSSSANVVSRDYLASSSADSSGT